MKRRAVLIAQSPESNPVPGADLDVAAWKAFLLSSSGGVWSPSEIVVLADSNRRQLLTALESTKGADYSLVVFSGHGRAVSGELPWPETEVTLASGEAMSEREFNTGIDRCTIIFDLCRRGTGPCDQTAIFREDALTRKGLDPVKCRALYDKALDESEVGVVTIYSTGVGNAASDFFSFSQYLIQCAANWTEGNEGVLTIQQAVSIAAEALVSENPQQKAEYHGGRRLRHFPFAVNV